MRALPGDYYIIKNRSFYEGCIGPAVGVYSDGNTGKPEVLSFCGPDKRLIYVDIDDAQEVEIPEALEPGDTVVLHKPIDMGYGKVGPIWSHYMIPGEYTVKESYGDEIRFVEAAYWYSRFWLTKPPINYEPENLGGFLNGFM